MNEQTEERDLDIEVIQLHPRLTSMRPYGSAELDGTVRKYMRLYDVLPPVVVYQERDGTYVLSDGYLRLEAARRLGRQRVRALVRQGSAARALANFVATNRAHGRPLTLPELQRNVAKMRALGASDAEIAHGLGYTVALVQQIATLEEW